MGRSAGWMTDLTGRSPMRSPGAPRHRREIERAFWLEIAKGMVAEDAARAVGMAPAVGCRWYRHAGGMTPFKAGPLSGRYLSFSEREEIALLKARGAGVREIARQLGRDPSTISRELRRNAATRGGKLDYRAWPNWLLAGRRRPSWLPTRGCTPTSRSDCLGRSVALTALRPQARARGRGQDTTSPIAATVLGCRGGVPSRSRTGSASSSLMMSP